MSRNCSYISLCRRIEVSMLHTLVSVLIFFLLWRFDLIPDHGLPLTGLRPDSGSWPPPYGASTRFRIMASPLRGFDPIPDHGLPLTGLRDHTKLGRIPLHQWSARLRDLYLITHSTQKTRTSMPAAGFETAIPASERPQSHALDRATTGIGC
jgi:hypothetical protein